MTDTPPTPPTDTPPPTPSSEAPPAAWFESFADDIKSSPNVTRYKTTEEAARALDVATKRLGVPPEQLMKIPTKPDDEAGWGEVYTKLGRPADAKGYGIKLAEGAAPETVKFVENFTEKAWKAGASTAVVAAAIETMNEATAAANEAATKQRETETTEVQKALKTEWGDKYDVYAKEIGAFIVDNGGQELLDEMNKNGLGNSLGLNKLLAKVMDMKAEPGAQPGDGGRPDTGTRPMSPAEAKASRLALESDPEKSKALNDGAHPMHATVFEERRKLLAWENPPAKPAA